MSRSTFNPPGRYADVHVAWEAPPEPPGLRVIEDASRGILARNRSPDLGFDWSLNPYRGCTHACAYCYARSWHAYLDLGPGADHDRVIVVKTRAPDLLEAAFERPGWRGEGIAFSGITDCYQPLEGRYRLTRACLEVAARYRNPVAIVTRSPLVLRDLDVLEALHHHRAVSVTLSLPFLDPEIARSLEPGAPSPRRRLQAMQALAAAGIPVGVAVAPIIPGLNDHAVPATLRAARDAGASWSWSALVRLAPDVAPVFEARLREELPHRADAVMARIRRARGGRLDDRRFGRRMVGEGPEWAATRSLYRLWKNRLGLASRPPFPGPGPFRRPAAALQPSLFSSAPSGRQRRARSGSSTGTPSSNG